MRVAWIQRAGRVGAGLGSCCVKCEAWREICVREEDVGGVEKVRPGRTRLKWTMRGVAMEVR